MEQWQIALVGIAICLAAVLLVSGIKLIVKKITGAKKKELDMNKVEYPLCFASLLLAYAGVVLFLKFGIFQDTTTALKSAVPFALSTQTIYVLAVQLARKGIKGLINGIKNLIAKLKASKNPIAELPQIIGEVAKENNTETQDTNTETQSLEEIGKNLLNTIFKKEDK